MRAATFNLIFNFPIDRKNIANMDDEDILLLHFHLACESMMQKLLTMCSVAYHLFMPIKTYLMTIEKYDL